MVICGSLVPANPKLYHQHHGPQDGHKLDQLNLSKPLKKFTHKINMWLNVLKKKKDGCWSIFYASSCSHIIVSDTGDIHFTPTSPTTPSTLPVSPTLREDVELTAGSWSGSARHPADLSWLSVGGFQPRALSASGPPADRGEQRSSPSPWQHRGHRVKRLFIWPWYGG